ncbi:MerR family transcriptional regulator [Celeribacter ethanolicus]|uniref:MerR family transcriptional regulator n=1 Tax=Celeribacter ethanolicus TaxID=1758178 RepID=UPI001FD2D369|nr:MerR family transcriptional regulator [Celeribacter ethanolicus]
MDKSPDAFRTISEVADWLDTPAHVLRFWESRFTQVKPVKRAGGRRYYRPADMALLGGIKKLLHDDGMTIRGVQKLLREHGVKYVASLSPVIEGIEPISAPAPEHSPIPPAPFAPMAEMVPQDDFDSPEPEERVIPFARPEPMTPPQPIAAAPETEQETVFGLQIAEEPDAPKESGPLPGQTSFDFALGPTTDLFEEPDLIEAEDDSAEELPEIDCDMAAMTAEEEAILTADIGTEATEPDAAQPPEDSHAAPPPSVLSAISSARGPLGDDLDLPEDPSDAAEPDHGFTAILGQLNHRHLQHVPQTELAALLRRTETLRARMAG